MKKLLVLLLIGGTYYIAGMYRSRPLLILFGVEVIFAVIMCLLPRFLKRKLNMSFAVKSDVAVKEAARLCDIRLAYRGKLPVTRFFIKLRVSCETVSNGGKNRKRRQAFSKTEKLFGNCRYGDSTLSFSFCAPLCGLFSVKMNKLRIYDYTSVFSVGKRLREKMTVAVLPKPELLFLSLPSFTFAKGEQADQQTAPRKGSAPGEIRQLREYVSGDAGRYIHWNYSARTDSLYVKEFEKNADSMEEVLLDMSGFSSRNAGQISRFYEILYSFMLTVIHQEQTVCVRWFDERTRTLVSEKASDKNKCGDILLKLYQTEFSGGQEALSRDMIEKYRAKKTGTDRCFLLDLDLCLWYGDSLLKQFDE